ncbi:MAG TPA: ferritin-like domain-containing protein [Polyangia bacterium]|nr:ferritin-like domain-containing protein [Polyangia bacterium]
MKHLENQNRENVIDLLAERLTFERSAVRLYDRVLERIRATGDPEIVRLHDPMTAHRDQEKEHEEWLEARIRELGGSAHTLTAKAQLAKTESRGLEEAIFDGRATLPQMLHALLAAELVDNAGWDLLVAVADEADDHEMKKQFKRRLHEEEDHLALLQRAVERIAKREIMVPAAW